MNFNKTCLRLLSYHIDDCPLYRFQNSRYKFHLPPGATLNKDGSTSIWLVDIFYDFSTAAALILENFTGSMYSHFLPSSWGGGGCWGPICMFDSSVIMPFPGVLCLCPFLYSVGQHLVSSLHSYTSVVSRAFMAGAASQAGDADSSRAFGLTSGLQGVRECPPWCSIVGATVTVHQFFCILH